MCMCIHTKVKHGCQAAFSVIIYFVFETDSLVESAAQQFICMGLPMRPRVPLISAPRVLNLQGLTAKRTILCGSWVIKLGYSCLHSKCFTNWMIFSHHLAIPRRFELSTKIYSLTAPILEGKDQWKSYKGVGNKFRDFPRVQFPYNYLIFYVLHWEWRSHIMSVDKGFH